MRIFKNTLNLSAKILLSYFIALVVAIVLALIRYFFASLSEEMSLSNWANVLLGGGAIFIISGVCGCWVPHNLTKRVSKILWILTIAIVSICIAGLINFVDVGLSTIFPPLYGTLQETVTTINLYTITLWLISFALWLFHTADEGEEAIYRELGWTLPPAQDKTRQDDD